SSRRRHTRSKRDWVQTCALPISVIGNPISSVGDMNTPIAMIVAGINLAQGNLLASLRKVRVYYVSFLKLIVPPVITVLLLFFLRSEERRVGKEGRRSVDGGRDEH